MPIKLSLLLILFLLVSPFCFSQNNDAQSVQPVSHNNPYYALSAAGAIGLYHNELSHKYDFLNGREYKIYHSASNSSPHFNSTFGLSGTIFVDGEVYPNCILSYDIYKDKLVFFEQTFVFENCNFIALNEAFIDSFYLKVKTSPEGSLQTTYRKYRFLKVSFPEDSYAAGKDGYYEVFRVGEMQLFVQHKAVLVTNQGFDAIELGPFRFEHVLNDILLLDGKYYEIDKKKQFIKLFPDKKKAINKKLNTYAFRFDLLGTMQLIEVLQFINSI